MTYFLITTFEETLVEDEIVEVDIFEHVMNFVIRCSEWLWNVDAELFLQENKRDHPVGFSPGNEVVLVKWCNAQEFKHLIFVNVLAHVAYDVRLQFFHFE